MSKLTLSVNVDEEVAPVTEFDAFDYLGLTSFNGELVMCSADGIFEYGGSADAGADIDAWFEVALTDMGILNQKRLRAILCSGVFSGEMLVSVSFDDETFVDYLVDASTSLNHSTWKEIINRAQRGTHVKIKMSNIDGSDFSIDAVDAVVVVLHNLPMDRSLTLPRARAEIYGVLEPLVGAMEIS
jgi:hypothetical protein